MQQRKFQHISRLLYPLTPSDKLGAADRKQVLSAQAYDLESSPAAITVPNCKIDILAREIDVMQRCRDP